MDKTILIVDDDEINRKIVEKSLKKEWNSFKAFDGEEAVYLLEHHSSEISLVLLDLIMPNCDGFYVLDFLKRNNINIPVIVITAFSDEEMLKHVYEYKIFDVVLKPVHQFILQNKVQCILDAIEYQNIKNRTESRNLHVSIYNNLFLNNDYQKSIEFFPVNALDSVTIKEMFNSYRMVDPATKDVYFFEGDKLIKQNVKCYEVWGRTSPCKNCISKEACIKSKEFMKLETINDQTFIIFALPIRYQGVLFSLELIKECSHTFLYSDHSSNQNLSISDYLLSIDEKTSLDQFTRLLNKNTMNNRIETKLINKEKIFLSVFDIDKFKGINDKYGHIAGDQVITYIAEKIINYSKEYNLTSGRIGGDEFAIISSDQGAVLTVSKQISSDLENHLFLKNDLTFKVTISFGIAESIENDDYNALIDRADLKMYEHKATKNNFEVSD